MRRLLQLLALSIALLAGSATAGAYTFYDRSGSEMGQIKSDGSIYSRSGSQVGLPDWHHQEQRRRI